ncbi:hypothetical protein HUT16_37135 [Kitasatospora sp. NA04385]|uniref:hypothetical protein n=1 Tax=Kitasatospora sp. NA04385 TaxID=2742135 RepID=UPI0015914575|nr:hypothetical protein [Kitasatospora sp. NA04385]QKW23962.1 hypothetical protein HUT16_37135 [Kitasatospora sp. NA04385]
MSALVAADGVVEGGGEFEGGLSGDDPGCGGFGAQDLEAVVDVVLAGVPDQGGCGDGEGGGAQVEPGQELLGEVDLVVADLRVGEGESEGALGLAGGALPGDGVLLGLGAGGQVGVGGGGRPGRGGLRRRPVDAPAGPWTVRPGQLPSRRWPMPVPGGATCRFGLPGCRPCPSTARLPTSPPADEDVGAHLDDLEALAWTTYDWHRPPACSTSRGRARAPAAGARRNGKGPLGPGPEAAGLP